MTQPADKGQALLDTWAFPAQSPLQRSSAPHLAPKTLFGATCDELARYFGLLYPTDVRYARSRPKLTFKTERFKLVMAFWSSGSNMAGQNTALEVVPTLYSLDVVRQQKAKGIKSDGMMLSNMDFFDEEMPDGKKGTLRVERLFEPPITHKRSRNPATRRHSNHCNLYGLDVARFALLARFLDQRVVGLMTKLHTPQGCQDYLSTATFYADERPGFADFLKAAHPDLHQNLLGT